MIKTLLILTLGLTFWSCNQNDRTINLEKIIFHTSVCYGSCPTYHLQVDSNKRIKLFAEQVFKNDPHITFELDSSKMGYFIGIVSDTTYNKLTNNLQNVGLKTLEFDGANCCDASIKTIIIYYDKRRKYLQSMFPPEKANKLISTLYEICETSKLERTNEKFEIEYE